MPTYSYHCATCGHDFEKVQRITEDPEKVCVACGAATASRVITSANFILKGSGWYSDAYSGGSNKKTEASGSAKADAKPATGDSAPAAPATGTPAAGAATTAPASAPASSSGSSTSGSSGSGGSSSGSGSSSTSGTPST